MSANLLCRLAVGYYSHPMPTCAPNQSPDLGLAWQMDTTHFGSKCQCAISTSRPPAANTPRISPPSQRHHLPLGWTVRVARPISTAPSAVGITSTDASTADFAFTDLIRLAQNSLMACRPEIIGAPWGKNRAFAIYILSSASKFRLPNTSLLKRSFVASHRRSNLVNRSLC